jgi:hypothetical protein
MYKSGSGVVSYPSLSQIQRCVTQLTKRVSLQPDVHGLAIHMETVFGHTCGTPVQPGVGLGGTVSRYDMEWLPGLKLQLEQVDQVQHAGVHGQDITRPVIPHDHVNFVKSLGDIVTIGPVSLPKGLSRVGVEKGKGSFRGRELAKGG